PIITLLGDNPMTIEVGSTFTDPGATASDVGDGDLTSSIVITGSVDSNTIGTYTVTYNVSDASGNAADSVTRTVNVVDTTAPVITLLGDTTVTIEVGTTYTDAGATATDNYDGDLTSSIAIVNNVDTSTVGTYTVTYNVSDASGNVAVPVTRTVNVVDTTAPVITLLGDTTVTIEVGTTYTDAGATATDNYDGDLTSSIAIVNNVDTSTVGTYTVTYNVSDASGNAADSVTRTVNVVDTTAPIITLLGDNPMTIEVGSTFTDPGATASDVGDGDLTSSIVITGSVDSNTIGTYTVTYNVSDASGNAAVPVTRKINVVLTLGIESIEEKNIEIYPIPAQTFFIVRQKTYIKKVKLYNIIGQIIYEVSTNNKEVRINTSTFKSGVYLMRINDNKKLFNIIIQ
ncbi:MAG: immunoglobulin-like domain-containing protein, partial [Flavobacteriaceae bacterium]